MPTDTPTTEAMVRKIAEFVGIRLAPQYRWCDIQGLAVEPDPPRYGFYFRPHGSLAEGAADRERVVLALPSVAFSYFQDKDGVNCVLVLPLGFGGYTTMSVAAETIGLAFITAVYQWILAQEPTNANP